MELSHQKLTSYLMASFEAFQCKLAVENVTFVMPEGTYHTLSPRILFPSAHDNRQRDNSSNSLILMCFVIPHSPMTLYNTNNKMMNNCSEQIEYLLSCHLLHVTIFNFVDEVQVLIHI